MSAMKTRLTLRPGQKGTKKLQSKYGKRLLAVRYRYDDARRVRLKTIELIEEEMPWLRGAAPAHDPHELASVRVAYAEGDLRGTVKSAGGVWQKDRKLWTLPWSAVRALGIESRAVP